MQDHQRSNQSEAFQLTHSVVPQSVLPQSLNQKAIGKALHLGMRLGMGLMLMGSIVVLPVLEAQSAPAQYPGRRVPGGKRDLCGGLNSSQPIGATPAASGQPASGQPASGQPASGQSAAIEKPPSEEAKKPQLDFMALIREVDAKEGAKTSSATPTVWVYVPHSRQDQYRQLWLSIDERDPQGNLVSTSTKKRAVPLPEKPGIMAIDLPMETSLEVNKTYRWSLQTTCAGKPPSSPAPVQFLITRVPATPTSSQSLKAKPAEQRTLKLNSATHLSNNPEINQLVEQGLWLDALAIGFKGQSSRGLSGEFQNFLQRHLIGQDLAQGATRQFPDSSVDQVASLYVQTVITQPLTRSGMEGK